jgi:D-xylose transport system substrate-binding protein
MEVLKAAIDAGKIKNVGEAYTDNWLPANAQRNMEQFLTRQQQQGRRRVASNDGTAGGAIAALAAQGLAGSVPVSGQDADRAALNRVALGTQTVSIWKDARELGQARRRDRRRPRRRHRADRGRRSATAFTRARSKAKMNARCFLKPVPITKDNLGVVIEAGWVPKAAVCQGVAGTVATDRQGRCDRNRGPRRQRRPQDAKPRAGALPILHAEQHALSNSTRGVPSAWSPRFGATELDLA